LDKSRELCQKSPRAKVKVRGQARAKLGRQVKLKAKLNERPWARGLKVVFDPSRSARGRGAWICADSPNCLAKALAKGKLARALRAKEPDLSELVLSEGRKFHRNGCQRDG
jgi:predicted RNA-binding protein YlxR (DUF448 family)